MQRGLRIRLSVMMFLTYVIWGAWLPILARYLRGPLDFTGFELGLVLSTGAIASVTAMFISAQIADRWFSTERFLFVSHLLGGIAMFAVSQQETFLPFFLMMLLFAIVYIPTLSLANSLSFHHIPNAERDFGGIRLWGTIGWIAASWPFFFLLGDEPGKGEFKWMFYVAGSVSIVLAFFSLALPHTPPKREARQRFAPLRALTLLREPAFLVLFLVAFSDAAVHQCYFQYSSPFYHDALGIADNKIMVYMSIGQIAEIVTMFALGVCLRRFGYRKVMAVGVFAHAVRFAIYAVGAARPELWWLVVASNVVHGAAYAFFFAAVYIYVDEYASKDIRASAQTLFNLVILGIGPFLANLLWGKLEDHYTTTTTVFTAVVKAAATTVKNAGETKTVNYQQLFLIPTIWALVTGVVLLIAFWPGEKPPPEAENGTPDTGLGDGEAQVEERLRDLGYVE